jgi:hypothetical protein
VSYFNFSKFAVGNALRVFLFLAMAHPALATDADVAHDGMEQPAMATTAPAAPATSGIAPGSAPVGFGWG